MKLSIRDSQRLSALDSDQRGVYSKAELQIVLAERHPAGFARRVQVLVEHGILRRFTRGWYVTEGFDLATLSQRLTPDSYISFGTVLARDLVIGPNPDRQVLAVKLGRTRSYSCDGHSIDHVGISERLFFGFTDVDGVQFADSEKAVLDVLYFHLRGRRYPFDIYSDINVQKFDRARLSSYLECYRNAKFVKFAKRVLEIK